MRLARILPGVAIGFVAVVILGPGNARPVLGVRVFAAPPPAPAFDVLVHTRDAVHRSARLVAAWRLGDVEMPAADVGLDVHVTEDVVHVVTGADGVAEVSFPQAVPDGVTMFVDGGSGVLAKGDFHVDGRLRQREAGRWTRVDAPNGSVLKIRPLRGQIVPPFPEVVAIRATCLPPGDPREAAYREGLTADASVSIDFVGASPPHVDARVPRDHPLVLTTVTPEAMRVDAVVEVDIGKAKCRYEGAFESVPGALWVDPDSPPDRIDVVAPGPRKTAYLSYYGPRGRVGGAVVPLAEDAKGFHRGSAVRPDVEQLMVVASGEPTEQSTSTVGWALPRTPSRDHESTLEWGIEADVDGESMLRPLRLVRIVDGMPEMLARENARVQRVRGIAIGVALVVGLLEIILLVREGRRAQRDLDAHFATQADAADGVEASAAIRDVAKNAAKSGSEMVTVLGAMIALAFGIVAAFVVAR